MYIPLPIIFVVIPVPTSSAAIPARTVSALTAVSASKGVHAGRTALISAFTDIASWSVTSIRYVAGDSPRPELPPVPLLVVPVMVRPLAESIVTSNLSPVTQPSPP